LERLNVALNTENDYRDTPSCGAAHEGYEGAVMILQQRLDVDVNAADEDGNKPLIRATRGGHACAAQAGGCQPQYREQK